MFDQIIEELRKNGLKFDGQRIEGLIAQAILTLRTLFPSITDDQIIGEVTDRLTVEFEKYDHLVPVIGKYLDLPFVDQSQKSVIRAAAKHVLNRLKLVNLA